MDWAGLISQVGFPIAVSVWLLARLDNRLGAFEKTAVAICQRLEDQANRCNECREWRRSTRSPERLYKPGWEDNPASV